MATTIWAAKDNNLLVARQLIETGTSVDLQEPMDDKSGSCYTALHWSALRGFKDMMELLRHSGLIPRFKTSMGIRRLPSQRRGGTKT